jgi:hypothetical protein
VQDLNPLSAEAWYRPTVEPPARAPRVQETPEIGTEDVRPYNLSPNLAGESRNPVPIS